MASSSSSEHHPKQRAPPLARHNSSFLGALKNIVQVPLNWFVNQDDHNATSGKRRRPLEQQTTEEFDTPDDSELGIPQRSGLAPPSSADSDDEGTRRSKRMRLHSPPREGYLDPPAASLRRGEPMRRASVIPRASSAVLPSSTNGRATLSPRRHNFPVARTMSIDPPSRPLVRHDSSAFNFGPPPSSAESDYDMAVDTYGDGSVPPSPRHSPRPSFRMRSSVTPQPQFSRPPMRYISEPPPLNSLISNPVFLHPPAQSAEPPTPAPTLGSLVDSVRTTKSPTRQRHSSLLFQSNPPPANNEHKDPPAERALHQLDVYKTPLLPTRMRSSNLPDAIIATTTPDMFNSRRRKRLVLMSDDKDRLGKKGTSQGKSPVSNETKPYAGEGVLRKLLARRKQETEDDDQNQDDKEVEPTGGDDSPRASQTSPPRTTRTIPPPPPVPAGSDWFSTAASGGSSLASGSSLRVGRTKTSRNHIQRPAKSRFSAVYEEDADDNMDDEESQRQKEFKMLEEAAQKAPAFSIPAGFSFAKDASGPINKAEVERPKDPPLTTLPFSLTKPAEVPAKPSAPAPLPSFGTFPAAPAPPPAEAPIQPSIFGTRGPDADAPLSSSSTVPNFFANSSIVKETPMPVAPPVLSFGATTSPSSTGPSGFFSLKPTLPVNTLSKVMNDTENPFWDSGDKKIADEKKSDMGIFSGFGKSTTSGDSGSATLLPAHGGATSAFGLTPKAAEQRAPSAPAPAQQPFLFGKPAQEIAKESSATAVPTSAFGAAIPDTPKATFSFGGHPAEAKLESGSKSLFGGSNTAGNLLGDASKSSTTIGLFGDSKPSTTSNLFGGSKPPSTTDNLFGDANKLTATGNLFADVNKPAATGNLFADASKPVATSNLFGDTSKPAQANSPYGQPAAPQELPAPSTFNFGAQPTAPTSTPATSIPSVPTTQPNFFANSASTTPTVEAPKTSGGSSNAGAFSFGQPRAPAEKEEVKVASFSFGTAPSTPPTAPAAPKPNMFSFGSSVASSPVIPAPSTSSSPAPVAFSFSGGGGGGGGVGGSATADVSSRPFFGFGQSNPVAPTDRPVTPPQNNDQEFKMEESPTRDLQQVNGSKPPDARPTIGGGAFSFGNSSSSTAGSSPFGGSQNSTSSGPFAFSGPTSSNPFAPKENKVEEPKPFGSFGQTAAPVAPTIQTSFSFGQPAKSPEDTQRPSTAGGFGGFGVTPTSATAPTNNAFSFGAATTSNAFGQPAATNSAPSSPLTFNQPPSFSFGAPAAASGGAFSFGSQPASPAGANLSLPSSGFGGGGGFGQPAQQQPSSPFSAPAPLTPSTSSGGGTNLFTIGAAPQQPPGGPGRAIKKLPTRRGAVKR